MDTIITDAINVFSSNDDIAKIVQILITFASLAPTSEEAGIKDNSRATRSWTTLGRTLNEDDWNRFGTERRYYKGESACSKAITRFMIANKYVAHLLRAGTGRYKIFMIWTMRSALEYSSDQRRGTEG